MATRPVIHSARRSGAARLDPKAYDREQRVDAEARRGKRLYGTAWSKARAGFLSKHPLCELTLTLEGREVSAGVVDHFYPHRGLRWLFWHRPLWVAMSKHAHDGFKQSVEARGEAALDELAIRLGLAPLSSQFPDRVEQWRTVFAEQRSGGNGRWI